MIRLFLFLFLSPLLLSAKLHCVVSIAPLKGFVEAIGDGEVDVGVMVRPGSSPHSYEPKPSQMTRIEKADCYFAVGVEFEKAWLPRFASQNPHMKIVDLSAPIQKVPMQGALHDGQAGEKLSAHEEDHLDPHIWTSPANVKIMAKEIYKTLASLDPSHRDLYHTRLESFLQSVDRLDRTIRRRLSSLPPHTPFMVFHPAWGYFAREYGLHQIPVEVEGKSPRPRQLMRLIDAARREKVRAIFTQPEFSDKSARLIARELGIPVVRISPLAPDWEANLLRLTDAITHEEK
ncbi:metal ABC transporter solute-binding protein, Zn/Mn family [Nitratifractor sp.]